MTEATRTDQLTLDRLNSVRVKNPAGGPGFVTPRKEHQLDSSDNTQFSPTDNGDLRREVEDFQELLSRRRRELGVEEAASNVTVEPEDLVEPEEPKEIVVPEDPQESSENDESCRKSTSSAQIENLRHVDDTVDLVEGLWDDRIPERLQPSDWSADSVRQFFQDLRDGLRDVRLADIRRTIGSRIEQRADAPSAQNRLRTQGVHCAAGAYLGLSPHCFLGRARPRDRHCDGVGAAGAGRISVYPTGIGICPAFERRRLDGPGDHGAFNLHGGGARHNPSL